MTPDEVSPNALWMGVLAARYFEVTTGCGNFLLLSLQQRHDFHAIFGLDAKDALHDVVYADSRGRLSLALPWQIKILY